MSPTSAHAEGLVFGAVELRLAERRLLLDGQAITLGSRAFDLLRVLIANRERVVGKDELLDEVWPGLVVEENNLQVQISGLRRVLGAAAIVTVPGQGYQFTLPAGRVEAAPPPPGSGPLVSAAPLSARVLVADDNRVNRLLLCRSLELMGHSVSAAANGREALELLKQQPFDLLMLDLAMPEMDGFAVLDERARDAALREVAVIVTSALGGVAPVARCIELGAEDFLHKPVDPWLLKARVDASLNAKLLRDGQREALRRLMPAGPGAARRLPDACVLAAMLQGLEAQAQTPEQLQELLSDWCTLMLDAIEGRGGELAQFSGDALLALFGNSASALLAGQDMSELMAGFNQERGQRGLGALASAVGLARGEIVVCSAATQNRAAYACVGEAVLRARRLASHAAQAGLTLLLDGAVCADQPAELEIKQVADLEGRAAFTLLAGEAERRS